MRPSFFATLAGMLVAATMLLVQAPQSYAATLPDGACDKALCLPQGTESTSGKVDQASPLQRLADWNLHISIDCPPGFHREGGECVLGGRHKRQGCPQGMHWNGNRCVANHNNKQKGGGGCVVGFHWNGNKCVADHNNKQKGGGGCVVGFHWNGNKCVADHDNKQKGGGGCVVGFHLSGGKCVPDAQGGGNNNEFPPIEGQEGGDQGFSCSHNDHLENGKCVPCKAGFHVEGDECVAD